MTVQNILISSVFTGVAAVILWVVFWAFFVPEVLPNLAWSGHEGLITPVFVVGCVGGAVGEARANI